MKKKKKEINWNKIVAIVLLVAIVGSFVASVIAYF